MNQAELKQFKTLFETVDISTTNSVKKWFQLYPELTINEHCMIMERSPAVIERLKRECGLAATVAVEVNGGFIRAKRKQIIYKKQKIKLPKVSNYTDDWVIKQYENGKSLNWIRETCMCSATKIYNILKTNGIPLRSHAQAVQSDNIYCSRKWLEKNYICNRYPLRKCAELAGVSHCTIRYWLIKFTIDTRSFHEIGKEL